MLIEADVAFLFIGGPHQVLHLAPVAAALSRARPDLRVDCIACDDETLAVLGEVRRGMDAPALQLTAIERPWLGRVAARLLGRRSVEKGPVLARAALALRKARAIVVPERTSAALRYLGWRRLLIHFRHGAGDRALKAEHRLKAFDLVVSPGEKGVARAIELQQLPPERLRSCGYVKLDYLAATAGLQRPRLFDNDRPTVVYNPHFDPALSSWNMAAELLERFAAQDRYNLVFAPHIRVSNDLGEAELAAWQRFADPDRLIVDLRSPRLLDMTYLRGADVYLGDVSSQLYEYLVDPRPAAFINAHGVDWRDNPRYAGWHLGEVADGADGVFAAIERARAGHAALAPRQAAAVERAIGSYRGASRRGAEILSDAIDAAA